MQAPPHIDDRLLVCYHAIFGISLIPDRHLRQLEKWTAFQQAHFTNGKNLRRLGDFFAEFEYILAAFREHDFLEEYRVKFSHTEEYRIEHVTTNDGITSLRCLEYAMTRLGQARTSGRVNVFIALHSIPGDPIVPIPWALGRAVMDWLRTYWHLFDPLIDRTALFGNTYVDLLGDEDERPAPRAGAENADPTLPTLPAEDTEPAPPAPSNAPSARPLLPRAHLPDVHTLLRQLASLTDI